MDTPFKIFSADEQAYAISQLDPFHDEAYKLNGAPSDQSADSVVITVNQEIVVDASDFGLPTIAGAKWDLHVATLPLTQSARAYGVYSLQPAGFSAGATTGTESMFKTLYPISLSANNSGDPTYCAVSTLIPILGISPGITSYVSNPSAAVTTPRCLRIIALSFEVVDESPTLYQQGACTVYSRASNVTSNRIYDTIVTPTGDNVNRNTLLYTDSFSAPPTRIQQATILPNSKTWKASEGAYVIARKTVDTVPFTRPSAANFFMISPPDSDNAVLKNSWVGRESLNLVRDPANVAYQDAFTAVTPYNVSGAYLTGLNSEFGTYRIRSKISYEIIPDPADTTLIPQATPSLPRNPQFEALLQETIHRLPPGVPQTMNPAGEWWKVIRKVSGVALKAVAPVLGITHGPIAGVLTMAAGNALDPTGSMGIKTKQKQKTKSTGVVRKKK